MQAARLAVAFRRQFKVDVIIDLVCYRRHGHNETDDPTFTQPVMYKIIAAAADGARRSTRKRLVDSRRDDRATRSIGASPNGARSFEDALNYARDFMPRQQVFALGGVWKGFTWAGDGLERATPPCRATSCNASPTRRAQLPERFDAASEAAHACSTNAPRWCAPAAGIDWGCAEMLAFGTLLLEGTNVRLSGQDSGRGTFSHRHAVLHDRNTDERYVPLDHLGRRARAGSRSSTACSRRPRCSASSTASARPTRATW